MKLTPLCLEYSKRNNNRASPSDKVHQNVVSKKPKSTDNTNPTDSDLSNHRSPLNSPTWIHESSRRLVCDNDNLDHAEIIYNRHRANDRTCNGSSGSLSDLSSEDSPPSPIQLPRKDWFANNHVLVNTARQAQNLPILHRNTRLDWLAQRHAAHMAQCQRIQHSCDSVLALQETLKDHGSTASTSRPRRVGENVFAGTSVRQMHRETMERDHESTTTARVDGVNNNARANLLSPAFDEFGMGTAKDRQGRLYMVQLFRSRATEQDAVGPERRISDTGNPCLNATSLGTGDFDPSWVWI